MSSDSTFHAADFEFAQDLLAGDEAAWRRFDAEYVPAIAMRLWADERRTGTIELLLTLPVPLWATVLGKFLAAWAFAGIALLLTFPIWITVNSGIGFPVKASVTDPVTRCSLLRMGRQPAACGPSKASITGCFTYQYLLTVVQIEPLATA